MQEAPADAPPSQVPPDPAASAVGFAGYEQALGAQALSERSVPPEADAAEPDESEVSQVTLLRRKRERGEVLTDEEAAVLRAYYNRYARRKLSVHLQGTREREWRELAAKQGLSVSSWIQERVVQALEGHGAVVWELREENQRLRDEIAALRGTSGHLSVENSRLQARLEAMESSLMQAMDQALRLVEAPA